MTETVSAHRLDGLIGRVVVIDLSSPFVCLGTLVSIDDAHLVVADADFHDLRDSAATREVYVYDSVRLGIRRNRARVLVSRRDIVAITLFNDIVES
jgi:hypothetical protein